MEISFLKYFFMFCFVYIETRGQPSPRVSSSDKLDVYRLKKFLTKEKFYDIIQIPNEKENKK